jgi:uncharacterized membrane protein YgcG
MCGQCQYHRGYQTLLIVVTRVQPVRRRKPVVAPRPAQRMRRWQSPPLPAKTTFELYRCWLNSRRRIYVGRIVTFLLGHQHAVENAVFNSAAVSNVIVARQMLGYSVPMLLIIPVCICSILSFCAFRFLVAHYNAERNKAPVAAPVRVDQLANALPAIKGVWGMALRQQLANFVGKSLHHHQMNDGLDEEYYISALLHKAGDKSAIRLALTTISRSPEMNGLMPMDDNNNNQTQNQDQGGRGGRGDRGGRGGSGGRGGRGHGGGRGGRYGCEECQVDTHSTDRCNNRRARLAREAEQQPQQLALSVAVATPGANPTTGDRNFRPDSRLHNQTAQAGGDNPGSVKVCDVCTRINNGTQIRHFYRTSCALADASRRPPERINSPHPLIRAEINRRRRQHNMTDLLSYVPFNPNAPRPIVASIGQLEEVSAVGAEVATSGTVIVRQGMTPNSNRIVMPVTQRGPAFVRGPAITHSRDVPPTNALLFDAQRRIF